ncbi:hypothetical protein [Streptomyces sp. NPDC002573]
MAEPNFEDRVFLASEAVYARIERGEATDVEAELMQAHADASSDEQQS